MIFGICWMDGHLESKGHFCSMKVLFLVWGFFQSLDFVCSLTCVSAQDYVCDYIPNDYPPGLTSLVFFVRNVGEINSTIFNYTSLSSVTSLTMRQSGITAIAPGAFAQFPSLESLNLHSNDLSHITSDWFIHKEGLEKLILINNSIAALDGNSFAGLVKLSDLNLSHNQIHTITSDCFSFLPGLKHLDLSHNKLRHLSVDSFIPLNRTKIAVHGNPWDCSCTVYEFSLFLRAAPIRGRHSGSSVSIPTCPLHLPLSTQPPAFLPSPHKRINVFWMIPELQTASLLPNEMQVLCMSPAHHRGRPVWNVSKCVNPTTDVVFTTGNSQNITPGGIHLSTVISLVVVLCALVLVICVLSVLYHRKQEQKHLLTIKPLPEEQEHASPGQGQAQPDFQAMSGISNRLESISCDHKMKQSNNRLLIKLDQTVPESQIYQIYSTRIFQTGEMSGRAKSAGPVLSRSDGSGKHPDTQMGGPGVWMVKDEEKHAGWTEKELEKFDDPKEELKEKHVSKGEEKEVGKTELEKKYIHERLNNEFITTLKTGVGYEQSLELGEKDEYHLEENVEGQGFLHTEDSVASEQEFGSVVDEYDLSSSLARSQAPQTHDNDFQALGDVENIPYFTIGADPKKQSPNPEQICTKASFEQLNLRPIRRTLSWPPTAAQWKKHLVSQTQQILNVSPEFIFVTQYHIGMLPSGMSSGVIENIPQAGCSRSPGQQLQIKDLVRFQLAETSMEMREFVNQSCNQDLSGLTRDYVDINKGQSERIQTHVPVNAEAHSDLVTINPLCKRMSSEAAEKAKMRSSKKKKTNQTPKGGQTRVIPGRKPKSGERDESKVLRDRQRDQSHSGSGAHPSGGSPSDDNLLVDNEYTFIDLLHEVVENHGRWTRERWRKSHINKQKIKQVNKP